MNHLIQEKGLANRISCDSAGTAGYHIGAPPDKRMQAAGARRGIPLTGQARQFVSSDFHDFDLILAMDHSNYQDILKLDPDGSFEHKVKHMCDFARQHEDRDVPDPYYGGTEGFDYVISLLLDACDGLLETITERS